MFAREPDRMVAAISGDDLPESMFAVKRETTAAFVNDAALRVAVDPAVANGFEVKRQELKAMGIDATKIRGAQRNGDKVGGFFGYVCRYEQRASKTDKC